MRLRRIHLLITLFLVCRAAGIAGNEVPGEALTQRIQAVSFIENKGQIIDQNNLPNPDVLFLLNRPGMNVQLRRGGFSYDLYSITRQEETPDPESVSPDPGSGIRDLESNHAKAWSPLRSDIRFHRIDFDLIGMNPTCRITASAPSSDYLNYYTTGTPVEGVTFVRHYRKVVYTDIYPGIDLEFLDNAATGYKYNFILHPGADLQDITIRIDGPFDIGESDENLLLETSFGMVKESIPASYLVMDDNRQEVSARFYRIRDNLFGIRTTDPIPNGSILIIDPVPERLWGTYYGGYANDEFWSCSPDASGNIYFSGTTSSTSNIASTGAHQQTFGGATFDAMLTRFTGDGSRLWCTYYGGGGGNDEGRGCAWDGGGGIYMCGSTNTYVAGVISTSGSHQVTPGGNTDAFLVKFDSNGIRQWGTYYGGDQDEMAFDCTWQEGVGVALTGNTSSDDNISSPGAFQELRAGEFDAFFAVFNAGGVRQWGTYFGGPNYENTRSCSSSPNGSLIISGSTASSDNIATTGAHQEVFGGDYDAFLAFFSGNGALQWATYYGGSHLDFGRAIVCLLDGTIALTGYTFSSNNISTTGSHQPALAGSYDAFLVKFSENGVRIWGTYYGGSGEDYAFSCSAYSDAAIYLAGNTTSYNNISSPGAYQESKYGGEDGFLVRFSDCIPPGITGPISGSDEVCEASSGQAYSIDPIIHAVGYVWILPAGAIITSGSGTTAIQVAFAHGASSGDLSVYGENACGNSDTATLGIIVNPIPYVAFVLCDTLTSRDAQPILLRGGIIPGGAYSGPGVAAGYFDPSSMPAGEDTASILYSYTSAANCTDSASQIITVLDSPTFTCGDPVTDIRDGKTYPTVLIGTQCWMSANLNFGDRIDLSSTPLDNCIPEKYCYEEDPLLCDSKGGLYTWDEMMQYQTTEGLQGICPPGWHIPAETEWLALFDQFSGQAYAGDAIKTGGASGLNGLLTGVEFNYTLWQFADSTGFFWSSSLHGLEKAWAHGIHIVNHGVSFYPSNNSNAFSVRCKQD